jgi:hypothetical protein
VDPEDENEIFDKGTGDALAFEVTKSFLSKRLGVHETVQAVGKQDI